MPCFLAAVEMNPRTLCACQSVAFMISARVAPLGRWISARIFAPLLSARGALAFLAAGLAVFLPALSAFLGAAALVLPVFPPLAAVRPLGAPFFLVAAFFDGAVSGATCAVCAATAAVLSAVVVSMLVMRVLFLSVQWLALVSRMTIHRSGWEGMQVKSAGKVPGLQHLRISRGNPGTGR